MEWLDLMPREKRGGGFQPPGVQLVSQKPAKDDSTNLISSRSANTYVDITMLIEASKTLKWCLDVFCGNVTHFLRFKDTYKPPVAVTVVHQEEAISFHDVGLTFYGRCKAV